MTVYLAKVSKYAIRRTEEDKNRGKSTASKKQRLVEDLITLVVVVRKYTEKQKVDEELYGWLIYIKREIRVAEQMKNERRWRTPSLVAEKVESHCCFSIAEALLYQLIHLYSLATVLRQLRKYGLHYNKKNQRYRLLTFSVIIIISAILTINAIMFCTLREFHSVSSRTTSVQI